MDKLTTEIFESDTKLHVMNQFAVLRSSRGIFPELMTAPLLPHSIAQYKDIKAYFTFLEDLRAQGQYEGQMAVFFCSKKLPLIALYDNTDQLVFVNLRKQFSESADHVLDILAEESYDLSADQQTFLKDLVIKAQEKMRVYSKKVITWRLITMIAPITLARSVATFSTFWTAAQLQALGPDVLSASAYITTIMLLLVTGINAPLNSVSTVVSNRLGSNDKVSIGRAFQQGVLFSLALASIIIILLIFITDILEAFGQKQLYVNIAGEFFNGCIWGAPATSMLLVCQGFGYSLNQRALVILSSVLGVGSQLFFGYGFGKGQFGMTKYGVVGLGYATAIQYWVSLIFLGISYKFNSDLEDFHLFKFNKSSINEHWSMFKELFLLGWPTGINVTGDLLSNLFRTMMIGWMGGVSLASKQVISQYLSIIVTPMYAVAISSNILVSCARGAGNLKNAERYGDIAMILGVSITVGFLIIMTAKPNWFISAFVDTNNANNEALIELLRILIVLLGIQQVPDTVRHICLANMCSLYHIIQPMLVSLTVIWGFGCGLGYYLAFPLREGIQGLFYGEIIGMTTAAALLIAMWKYYLSDELSPNQHVDMQHSPKVSVVTSMYQNLINRWNLFKFQQPDDLELTFIEMRNR